MRVLSTAAAAFGALPAISAKPASYGGSCDRLTAKEVRSMGNNTLFTRWRPYSHFNAPAGWMNDPCGAMYNPSQDLYYLFYQWHPEHINWGNISWGQATSKDLITWTDHNGWQDSEALALGPTGFGNYNGLGIFSGTAQPVNLQGQQDGTLALFYTSVKWLPTSWTLPYHRHTESQSIAISEDGGQTFHDIAANPVIWATTNSAPMYWNLTGFRDPFVEPFPELDAVLKKPEPRYYAVFGSGIKGVGPRIPLWSAPATDLTDWTFEGALWEPAGNSSLGPLLSTRSYGYNFEVSGFFALPDSKGEQHYFVQMGAEGGNISYAQFGHVGLWNQGTVSRRANGSAEFTPLAGGQADWALGYAATSFNDTKNNRRVQYAWVQEDITGDSGLFSVKQQGFQGTHTLPRELFVHEVSNVVDDDGILNTNKASVNTKQSDGTYLAQTLGYKPLPDVVAGLQQGASTYSLGKKSFSGSKIITYEGSQQMQIEATVSSATGAVGLTVAASPDGKEYTTISYQPTNNTLLVDRSHSSLLIPNFNDALVTGYFYPYSIKASDGSVAKEPITMNVFLDGSLLEIYVNDRFALSTRIYPSMTCSTGYGVYVESGSKAMFSSIKSWTNLLHVWTDRPLNSSSPLVFDTAAETNDYVWWPGN